MDGEIKSIPMVKVIETVFEEFNGDIDALAYIQDPKEAYEYFSKLGQRFDERCETYEVNRYFEVLKDEINRTYLRLNNDKMSDLKEELYANESHFNYPNYSLIYEKIAGVMRINKKTFGDSYLTSEIFRTLMETINKQTVDKNSYLCREIGHLIDFMPTQEDITRINEEDLGEALIYAYEGPSHEDFIQKFPGAIEKLEKMDMAAATDIDSEKRVIHSVRANPYLSLRYGRNIMTIQ
ncbi:MAG: hypothetical protein KAR23_00385 [Candidatus Aenigmarchaeota archaeon]|nr:hypothetical protein [Candidatus Aenigmarchaeota archaeon]